MRKLKAGKRGLVTKYISRSKAIRKLQVSLKDFRRLCILKGIYPRQPPQKLKKLNKTYYHVKDINFLSTDTLINRFREQKIWLRKYKHARAKKLIGHVKSMVKRKPKYSLTHLIRERYPEFPDALRDLDDALSLVSLFSIFPAHKEFQLGRDRIQKCTELLRHFNLYVIQTKALKKAFLSIKGIYYQFEIMGQLVTYLAPYEYPPSLPNDVDYRVMSTFLEFYEVLLKFVMYKLYTSMGKKYPPILASPNDDFFEYGQFELEDLPVEKDDRYQIDEEFKDKGNQDNKGLFDGLVFFLNSQVPRPSLELVIKAQGGQVFWDGLDQSINIDSPVITHVITDRQGIKMKKTKEYIQPQWIYDSLNNGLLLGVKEYAVGKKLPPHLSPFVDTTDSERYVPQREIELRKLRGEEVMEVEQEDGKEKDSDDGEHDPYDIVQEQKKKKQEKKKDLKDLAQMSKDIMSNKNRKLLKAIEVGKRKGRQQNERLKSKSKPKST